MATPIILDTDIGGDIDDTWALAHLLRSPELSPRLILSGFGDTHYRAALCGKLLERAGRADVPIGIGESTGASAPADRRQGDWLKGYDLARYPGAVHEDGVGELIRIVMSSDEPVTIIAIGPATNLGRALEREPRLAQRCRLVGMFGSVDSGMNDGEPPIAEYNVTSAISALQRTLAAPFRDILLTPLDTCGRPYLAGEDYRAIWSRTDDPLLRAVIESYCLWAPRCSWLDCDYFAVRSTILFDCVAVYLAYAEALVEIETLTLSVTDDGRTVRDPHGRRVRAALRWKDLEGFRRHLAARLLGT